MNKKISKLFFINAISFVSIPIIVSCSKSPNINDTNNVYNGFLEKQINITIDSTKPNYSLEDLKDSGFKFEIKPYQGNNELEKEYYEQLNKSLSKSSIKLNGVISEALRIGINIIQKVATDKAHKTAL